MRDSILTCVDWHGRRTTITVHTTEPAMAMRVGLSVTPTEYTKWFPQFPGAAYARVFVTAEAALSAVPLIARTGMPTPIVRAYSYKKPRTAAHLAAWLATKPAGVPVEVSFHHEPEDDWWNDPAGYAKQWKLLRQVADDHPERHLITLTNIHNLYACRWKRGVDWRRFMLPGVADAESWDIYAPGALDGYEAAESMLGLPIAATREFDCRLKISEVGADRKPWDTRGEGRAAWLTSMAEVAAAHGCETFGLWCSTDSKGDFRPHDAATASAFSALIARFNSPPAP